MKNPLRMYEDYFKDSDPVTTYFFNNILNLYVFRFKWEGLPSEILPQFIGATLFWRGAGAFIYDNEVNKYAFMNVALSGLPDIYNIPDERWAFAANGYIEEYGKENSVILWDNLYGYPFAYTAQMYAKEMANVWRTRSINIFAQRTPVVLTSSDQQQLSYQLLGEQYENYIPIFKVNDSLDIDRIKALKIDAPFIADKMDDELKRMWSQILTDMGYDNNPVEKRERAISNETEGNNGQIEGMRNISLTLARRCADTMNKLWGLNVSVDFNSQLPTMTNMPWLFTGSSGDYEPETPADPEEVS